MRLIVTVAALLLLFAPVAAAGPQPVLYFLKDGEIGPVGAGVLNATYPDSLDPSLRPVGPTLPDEVPPLVLFVSDEQPRGTSLRGPVLFGLWMGHSAVLEGNLTARLYLQHGDGTLEALSAAGTDVAVNSSDVPDPGGFVPPDPTDPEGAVAHIVAQGLGWLLQAPVMLDLGRFDLEVPSDARLAVGLSVDPPEGAMLPIPTGAAVTVHYDGQLMPSFVYVPWYTPDPPRDPSPGPAPPGGTGTPPPPGGTGTTTPPGDDGASRDSPGVSGLLMALALLGGAMAALRRRA